MAKNWRSQRGDEWCYEVGAVRAAAGFGGGTVSIEQVRVRGRLLLAADVQHLLFSAFNEFDDARVVLDVGTPEIQAALAALRDAGIVTVTAIDAPSSKQVRVLEVRSPSGAA